MKYNEIDPKKCMLIHDSIDLLLLNLFTFYCPSTPIKDSDVVYWSCDKENKVVSIKTFIRVQVS